MSVKPIKEFSIMCQRNPELAIKLKAIEKIRDLIALGKENGFEFQENSLYPPNEPQFTEDQLSERMVKALLRA